MDTTGYDGHAYLAPDKCIDFKRELWFELGKCTWRKYWSVNQDHMKYVCNNIVKTLRVNILCYAKRVREIHDLDKYPPRTLMKGEIADASNWIVRNQELTAGEVQLEIKDGIP